MLQRNVFSLKLITLLHLVMRLRYASTAPCVFVTYLLSHSLNVQDILWRTDSHSAYETTACFLYWIRRFITVLTKARHNDTSSWRGT